MSLQKNPARGLPGEGSSGQQKAQAKHTTPKEYAQGPEGVCLATIRREKGYELRLMWDTFEGHPYLALRLWERMENGKMFPTKKGLSIRLHELPELVAGFALAADEIQARAEREAAHD